MRHERREMMMMMMGKMKVTRVQTERQESEVEKERIKDQGGEDRMGNHTGRIDRGEAKWNKVNK